MSLSGSRTSMDSRSGPRSSSSLASLAEHGRRPHRPGCAAHPARRGTSASPRHLRSARSHHAHPHQVSPSAARIVASNSGSRRFRRSSSTMAASAPTSTRSGVSGSSIAPATANATVSGPGRPSGPHQRDCRCRSTGRAARHRHRARMVGAVVLHAGCDVPRLDDHHADPEMAELEVQRLRHRLERMLRGRIGPFERRADLALHRADVDEHPAPPFAPPRHDRLGHPERAEGVDVEHLSETLQGVGLERARTGQRRRCSRRRRAHRPRRPQRAPSRRPARRAAGPARPADPPAGRRSRAVATTSCPRSANTSTVARPMARAAPVTSTRTVRSALGRRAQADQLLAHLPQSLRRLGVLRPAAGLRRLALDEVLAR